MNILCFLAFIFITVCCVRVNCQLRRDARWCVINDAEMRKCIDLQRAIYERMRRDDKYPPTFKSYDKLPNFDCLRAKDRFECMQRISEGKAELIQLDPGMGYTAGEYYTMMPIVAERYKLNGVNEDGLSYLPVAVVRKDNPRNLNINNLKGAKACHTGVGRAAGWVYPISTLIEREIMPVTECNVPTKSAAQFFGDMCAPNGLARYYNPFGNNPVTICKNCKGPPQTFCTSNDPFAGYAGAFECMGSGAGDVAFVRDLTILEATTKPINGTGVPKYRAEDFELLCLDGKRAPVSGAAGCNWGKIASHTVMTSQILDAQTRDDLKSLMLLISSDFGETGKHRNIFRLFDSDSYGQPNVLVTDASKHFADVGGRNSYFQWAGAEYRRRLGVLNTCPIQQARWCVISDHEMSKCENMIMAFQARGLKPDLNCILGSSQRDCMAKISAGDADMITLDASDVYLAGKFYDMVPIAAEDYSGYDAASYYAVAIARRMDSHLTIFNLKQRRSCHSGVMKAAGWVVPVDKLIETGQIRITDCNTYYSVGEFFSKSCVPGVLSSAFNSYGTNPVNLCEACASGGRDRCRRNSEELYYGNSGAFRCLTEFGGDVAFVKHTTVRENTDGRNTAEWARNRRSDDYELLCNDGTRKQIDQWANCNMGKVPANAILTASFKTDKEREIYWTLLNYAQQFFASDDNPDFKMFGSKLDHRDLIFQDSTVRLVPINKDRQNYRDYLGMQFIRSMERMENIDCITNKAPLTRSYISSLSLTLTLGWIVVR